MTKPLERANLSLIPAYKFLAIKLRFEGYSGPEISAKIKLQYDKDIAPETIRWWFYKGGPLATFYREYADKMVELEMEEARDFIKGNVSKAAKILAQVMANGGSPAQVIAAKEFLERGLGKTPDKLIAANVNANIDVNDVMSMDTPKLLALLEALDVAKLSQNNGNSREKQANNTGPQ